MFISDQINKLINRYDRTVSNGDIKNSKEFLKNLKVNDEVKVTVVKAQNGEAVVKMADGNEMNITGNIPEGTSQGDMLYIRITGNKEGMPLTAEVITNEKSLEIKAQELTTLLKNIGITPNKENLDIVNDMNKAGVLINKDNLSKLFNSIENNISKDNAIFMIKNGIEITTSSAQSFNNMITDSDFLESNLKTLIDTLTNAEKTLSSYNQSEESNSNISKNANNVITNKEYINTDLSTNEDENLNTNINEIKNEITYTRNIDTEKYTSNDETENIVNINTNEEFNNESVIKTSNSIKLSTEIIDKPVDNVDNQAKNNENKVLTNMMDSTNVTNSTNDKNLITQTVENLNKMDIDNQKSDILSKSGTTTLTKDEVITNDANKILSQNKINNAMTKLENINEEALDISNPEVVNELSYEENDSEKNINKLNEFENETNDKIKFDSNINLNERKEKIKTLRNEIGSIFREVRNSKEFPEEISLKRIFKSFKDVIGDIENSKDIFDDNTKETLSKEVGRMKENLNLISDLNKYNNVIHIPLQMNNNKSVAELYIFNGDKQNSKKKVNENNATMFLSLGTANIGQVESYIKIVNKTVECNFMTESKDGAIFINENKEHLSDLLSAYGYTLIKANAEIYNGKTLNIFEAIEKNNIKESLNAFDAKA